MMWDLVGFDPNGTPIYQNNWGAYSQWIPVEDRLPDELKSVLILVPDLPDAEPVVDIGWYATSSWGVDWIGREGVSVFPTHWMPLPEPPEVR